jgi:hypothetical protein
MPHLARTIETISDKSEQDDAKAGACAPYLINQWRTDMLMLKQAQPGFYRFKLGYRWLPADWQWTS